MQPVTAEDEQSCLDGQNRGLNRLRKLRELNADPNWVNADVYRMMYMADLYIIAYERIKSTPGNMTPGGDKSTIDGFSMKTIERVINDMKSQQFQFTRARRVHIPKANGKLRPLGIPSPKDKIVQEVMRMILEAVYDGDSPTFRDCSHGFRPNKGTHTCLKEIRSWNGISWLIEGDIKACFDEIDHHTLVEILSKRISDRRFLDLVWKALTAGYLEGNIPVNSLSGSPQGSIVSPILANIYLHELDVFVEGWKEKLDTGKRTKRSNPAYNKLVKARKRKALNRKPITKEDYRKLTIQMRETPSLMHNDPGVIRIRYVRYADDWIIGLDGPKSLAEELKAGIKTFLEERLKLQLSVEKTYIRNARREKAFFLGTELCIDRAGVGDTRVIKVTWKDGTTFRKRTTGSGMTMTAPKDVLIGKLANKGYCDKQGKPTAKPALTVLDSLSILSHYNAILRGIRNYYNFVDNPRDIKHLQYILQYSAAKTLCRKYQISLATLFEKHGISLAFTVYDKDSNPIRTGRLDLKKSWSVNKFGFLIGDERDILQIWSNFRTRSKLETECCICGETEDVEMHHVRHVRKGNPRGFNKVLSAINRKQVPVCRGCHTSIHGGEYDGLSLKDFKNPKLARA